MNSSIIWYPLLYRTTPIFSKNGDWKLGHIFYLPMVAPFQFYFTWLNSGDLRRSYGMYISQLIRFARRCTSIFNFHFQYLNKPLTPSYICHEIRENVGKFFRSFSELLSKHSVQYRSNNMFQNSYYDDPVYQLGMVKSAMTSYNTEFGNN